ncbi:MAG: methyltransferase domain-containing protein [Desulfuromonas sp.]|nr:methyltransferase domain-containing protein [Desulfuromonas sp.]
MSRFTEKGRDWLDAPERKRTFNAAHFAAAAARYDMATMAMSFGRDQHWKDRLVDGLSDLAAPICLDLACGTGDLSRRLAARYPGGHIIALDLSAEMLALAPARGRPANLRYLRGDMHDLPLAAASCSVVTGGYALRNAPDLDRALAEISRVLRPGGQAAFLDFARPTTPAAQRWQYHLLRFWCGMWGWLLSGSREVHGYIAESLRTFPVETALDTMLQRHGLVPRARNRVMGGMLQVIWSDRVG